MSGRGPGDAKMSASMIGFNTSEITTAASAPCSAGASASPLTPPVASLETSDSLSDNSLAADPVAERSSITGVAAPVCDTDGQIVASVSVYGPGWRFPGDGDTTEIERLVRETAERVGGLLGD